MNDLSPFPKVYIWRDEKKFEYQASLRNEQTCIVFENMLCAAAEGCNTDNLCDIFNGMLENAISPLFPRKQHKSNSKRNIKTNFTSNPCSPVILSLYLKIIAIEGFSLQNVLLGSLE